MESGLTLVPPRAALQLTSQPLATRHRPQAHCQAARSQARSLAGTVSVNPASHGQQAPHPLLLPVRVSRGSQTLFPSHRGEGGGGPTYSRLKPRQIPLGTPLRRNELLVVGEALAAASVVTKLRPVTIWARPAAAVPTHPGGLSLPEAGLRAHSPPGFPATPAQPSFGIQSRNRHHTH